MPVIAFASPKGGVGKTTAALLLATEIAQKGIGVTIIDADPQGSLQEWSTLPDRPDHLHISTKPTQETIFDDIENASSKTAFVIIDLEGSANMVMAYAISRCDLVIIPLQPSDLDLKGAARAVQLVKEQEKLLKRKIPHALLFTRTSAAITTRAFKHIQIQLKKANILTFETQLIERQVYKELFSFGGTLEKLDPNDVSNLDKAIANARAFASETIRLLKKPDIQPAIKPAVQNKQKTGVA